MQNRDRGRRLIIGSAIIGSIGTFGLHVLLPALPAIATAMQVHAAAAQLLISLSLVAIAFGNLVIAPLSDRYGRRPVVLAGLGLFVAGSLAGIVAPSLQYLVLARIVQAFGGGAAMAVMRATIMDFFGPARAASAIAATATAILLAPMFAPTLGGLVIEWFDWRAVFALSGLLGGAVMLFAARKLIETRPADHAAGPSPRTLASYGALFRSRPYLTYIAFGSSLMSMIYTFVTGAPYVAIDVLGISPSRLGLLLFFPASASFAGFLVAARFVHRVGGPRLMQIGALLAFTGAASMAVFALLGIWHPLAIFIPGMLIGFANAVATPSSTTAAITRHPAIAGAASGLMGFVHLLVAAGATQLVAFFANHSPVPLAATLLGLSLVSFLALRSIARMHAQPGLKSPPEEPEPTR